MVQWEIQVHGGGGVLPYENNRGACGKFLETPLIKSYQNLILWAWLQIYVHHRKVPILK